MNIVTKRTRTPALLQPSFERMFDRFFDPWDMAEPRLAEPAWVPAVDVTDASTEYVLKVDAPGFHKENLDNEGVFVAMVPPELADAAVTALRDEALGAEACIIGRVTDQHPGIVALRTGMGSTRVVDMLPGDQLPRIC